MFSDFWTELDYNGFGFGLSSAPEFAWSEGSAWWLQAYCQGFLCSILVYLLYLEMSPQLGGILIRPGNDGKDHFNLIQGITPYLKQPFQSLNFWYPSYWEMNIYIFTQAGTALFIAIKLLFEYIDQQ